MVPLPVFAWHAPLCSEEEMTHPKAIASEATGSRGKEWGGGEREGRHHRGSEPESDSVPAPPVA